MERDAIVFCATGPSCGQALDLTPSRMQDLHDHRPTYCSLCLLIHALESLARRRLVSCFIEPVNPWGEDE